MTALVSPLHKIAVPLEPLIARLELEPEALACLRGVADVPTALERFRVEGLAGDEARLLAHALPPREAVWWSCLCARDPGGAESRPADLAAVAAAEAWVRRPSEDQRRAAQAAAEATAFQTPEAWAAQAAAWSGGSMAPPGAPVVPPPPHLCGIAVIGAVRLALARHGGEPAATAARLARFIASARDIASGGSGRIEPPAP